MGYDDFLLSGYELKDIQLCVNWMYPCAAILLQSQQVKTIFHGVRTVCSQAVQLSVAS